MDETPTLIALTHNLGNLINEEKSLYSTCVDITGIELSKNLFLESSSSSSSSSMTKLPLISENRSNSCTNGVVITIESSFEKPNNGEDRDSSSLIMTRQTETCLIFNTLNLMEDETDRSLRKNTNVPNRIKRSETWVPAMVSELVDDLVSLDESGEAAIKVPKRTFSASLLEVTEEIKVNKPIPSNFPPLWGLTSIRGRRAEMEDSAVALPRFLSIPPRMLSESPLFTSLHTREMSGHLYGVFDGHGGCQVANYCRERMHVALAEEIGKAKDDLSKVESGEESLKEKWLEIFENCFHILDNEVGGFASGLDAIAPESVGSTATVAIVCNTHIIVANCGDSRAVLNRGKVPMPLSVDHKPNREDECERVEAAGGKVINWDGYRVSGVLAVSRSIGDRYLRPYVIADPELMFVSRTKEDECLIVATDGLWDVITNDEACDLARKRILLWHKRNGASSLGNERGTEADPAAQDAAEYLSKLAYKRGSADNISVIVVDLKAQRKFKKKT